MLADDDQYHGEKQYRVGEGKSPEVGSQLEMGEGVREGLTEELVEQRSEGAEGESHTYIWERVFQEERPVSAKAQW